PQRGWSFANVGPRTMARLHAAHRGQRMESHPHRGTADADLRREIALGRQPVARPELLALDEAAHVSDHLLGAALYRAHFPGPDPGRSHKWIIQSYMHE